ncbi:MAG: hypothetical protein AAF593_10220 [Planctomycetota bacterium]
MPDDHVGECDRCGAFGPRKRKLMLYRVCEMHPEAGASLEYFCDRCLKKMKRFAIAGFILIGLLVMGVSGFALWAIYS